jgi:hypothetical protein
MAQGVKAAWRAGKFIGKKRPDYAAIGAKARGRKRSREAIERTRKGVARAWRRGLYSTAAAVANRRAAQLKRTDKRGRSVDFLNEIRAKRDLEKLRPRWSENMKRLRAKWTKTGKLEEIKLKQRAKVIGSHGFGRNRRGNPSHPSAKFWRIRSPYGEVFEFSNLCEWVRQNLWRFLDERPECRLPFAVRVRHGVGATFFPRRRNAATHYKGWVAVGVYEKRADPLARNIE